MNHRITHQQTISSSPKRSIDERDPYVDPINLVQVDLLHKISSSSTEANQTDLYQTLLRQCIQSIAAGMRTTG